MYAWLRLKALASLSGTSSISKKSLLKREVTRILFFSVLITALLSGMSESAFADGLKIEIQTSYHDERTPTVSLRSQTDTKTYTFPGSNMTFTVPDELVDIINKGKPIIVEIIISYVDPQNCCCFFLAQTCSKTIRIQITRESGVYKTFVVDESGNENESFCQPVDTEVETELVRVKLRQRQDIFGERI